MRFFGARTIPFFIFHLLHSKFIFKYYAYPEYQTDPRLFGVFHGNQTPTCHNTASSIKQLLHTQECKIVEITLEIPHAKFEIKRKRFEGDICKCPIEGSARRYSYYAFVSFGEQHTLLYTKRYPVTHLFYISIWGRVYYPCQICNW